MRKGWDKFGAVMGNFLRDLVAAEMAPLQKNIETLQRRRRIDKGKISELESTVNDFRDVVNDLRDVVQGQAEEMLNLKATFQEVLSALLRSTSSVASPRAELGNSEEEFLSELRDFESDLSLSNGVGGKIAHAEFPPPLPSGPGSNFNMRALHESRSQPSMPVAPKRRPKQNGHSHRSVSHQRASESRTGPNRFRLLSSQSGVPPQQERSGPGFPKNNQCS